VAHAVSEHDGHLTIYRFTGNWRVGFATPAERDDIDAAAEGKTFREAARKALAAEAAKIMTRPTP
jgi:hypothetical protein